MMVKMVVPTLGSFDSSGGEVMRVVLSENLGGPRWVAAGRALVA
jgi:hypothetical protein